ncbi:hypothetical protein [Rickettsia amblyommatis]|uniref:hypothetical protein n=1 Tax=Rickettsia amblyommatis TaxID=33989 RepID=UPI000AB68C91|nr:hypothetical protein [Rickettsia amblyommatis]
MPNIDLLIFTSFLAINLLVGLLNIKNIKNIREYTIGTRNFSTDTIVATLIATWISTSTFLINNSRIYTDGLLYLLPSIFGNVVSWLLISDFIAPRFENFWGSLSAAEIIGEAYGNKVRILTSIVSILMSIGRIAMQFYVASLILQLFFNISNFYIDLCIAVIISYSAFGGVKSVTFTEAVQFFTYSAIIPVIGIVVWNVFSDPHIVLFSRIIKSYIGFKGLIVGIIMAMIIASTNSYINVAVVMTSLKKLH